MGDKPVRRVGLSGGPGLDSSLRTPSGLEADLVMSGSGHYRSGHHRWHTAKCSRFVSMGYDVYPWIRLLQLASGLVGNTVFDWRLDIRLKARRSWDLKLSRPHLISALTTHSRHGWRDEDPPLWRPSPRPSCLCPEPTASRQDQPSLVSFSSEGQCHP